MEILRAHNLLVRQQVKAYSGFEVKAEGDGFMVAFQSGRRALECAISIQRSVSRYNQDMSEPLRLRIGLHAGEVIREANDFFGKNVMLAARVASAASGGEILVSSLLKDLTESSGPFDFDEGREVELKGLSGTHRLFSLAW